MPVPPGECHAFQAIAGHKGRRPKTVAAGDLIYNNEKQDWGGYEKNGHTFVWCSIYGFLCVCQNGVYGYGYAREEDP